MALESVFEVQRKSKSLDLCSSLYFRSHVPQVLDSHQAISSLSSVYIFLRKKHVHYIFERK